MAMALTAMAACSSATETGTGGATPAAGSSPVTTLAATMTTTAAATTTTRPLRTFTVAGVGDILSHGTLIAQANRRAGGKGYEMDSMFAEVRPQLSAADLAICHQETPISADNTELTKPMTISFNAPTELAAALKNAGFDGCSTASNHTWDRNLRGVRQTIDVLEAAGIKPSGSSRTAEEAPQPPIHDVKGVKVGHLAYTYTIYNDGGPSTAVPPEAPWLKNFLWPAIGAEGILTQARALKARGAEFVIASMHWGDQYVRTPNAQQRSIAKQLLESPDVDLILGDHVHVVQPCEKIGNKYVVYGMGNFVSNQSPSQDRSLTLDNEDGTVNTFTIAEVSPGTFATTSLVVTPTHVQQPNHVVQPVTPASDPGSYNRTQAAITALGPACDVTLAS